MELQRKLAALLPCPEKKDDASEEDSELTSKDEVYELSSNDRVGSDIIEAEVVEDNDLVDDEHGVGDS